jgi:hypothetical protein
VPLRESVLGLHVAALILVLHGTPAITYGTLRYAWAWKHVGIVDYIQRHGSVDPSIPFLTAYHNWPGFFALAALYTHLAGFASALSFASWGPVFFNLLFVGALVVLFRALTPDPRRVWLGAWFFVSSSWVGQDYFSPQAFAYFLFLVAVTVCVAWFRATEAPAVEAVRRFVRSERGAGWFLRAVSRADVEARWHADAEPRERAAMVVLVLLIAVVVASSHQLTPMMLVVALGALVVFQRLSLRSLPVLVAAIAVGWVVLFAVGFLRGNLYWIVASVGTLTTNAGSSLLNLAEASHGQQVVARIDRTLTVGVWALGALGFLRLLRRGRLELTAAALAVAPFAMLAGTSYGGEIGFRVYFFSLPAFALLATGLFYPADTGRDWRPRAAATAAVGGLLLAGLLVAYYGKEAQNYFPKDEVGAAQLMYRTAPRGSLLVSGLNDYSWAYTHYEWYSYLALGDLLPHDRRRAIAHPAATVLAVAHKEHVPCAYVIVTAAEAATVDMTGLMPAGSLQLIDRRLTRSHRFRVLWRDPAATVFAADTEKGGPRCSAR